MNASPTVRLQHCLERLQAGDEAGRPDLLSAACARLTRLARKMFRADGRVQGWEATGEVFQNALLRLSRTLEKVTPSSLREFFRLAAVPMRRELIDLARHPCGRADAGAKPALPTRQGEETAVPGPVGPAAAQHEPRRLAAWAAFHEQIGALPEEEREVFELVWYHGLPHAEAAVVLNSATKTVQRRWQAACLRLHQALRGELPAL